MEIKTNNSIFFEGKMYQSINGIIETDNERLISFIKGEPIEKKETVIEDVKDTNNQIKVSANVENNFTKARTIKTKK